MNRLATLLLWIIFSMKLFPGWTDISCLRKYIENKPNHLVCVCNATYCDEIIFSPKALTPNTTVVYHSDGVSNRFRKYLIPSDNAINEEGGNENILLLDEMQKMQEIIGFGGAFTDAAGINIASLPNHVQKRLLKSYFGKIGIGYNTGRIPIASCDFSTREYSYDDEDGDFNLTNFDLVDEDHKFKIPYLLTAQQLSGNKMRYFGSPWSAPGWLKVSGTMKGNGTMKGKAGDRYHKTWANYFIKFLKAYEEQLVKIWGLTVQNEPTTGFIPNYAFQTMGFTGEMERDFVKLDLGPTLRSSKFADVKLMVFDDGRDQLVNFTEQILNDKTAASFVDGIAMHWYADTRINPVENDKIHELYPNKFLLMTEACAGFFGPDQGVSLGNWTRAEQYAHDIIQNLNHWATGWVDWNLALNLEGGPNWVRNFVDAPIIVNASEEVFYKQPTFYAIGHFSKFVIPGSRRILHEWKDDKTKNNSRNHAKYKLEVASFVRPDSIRVAIILNRSDEVQTLKIMEKGSSMILEVPMPKHSIKTVLWKIKN